MDDSEEHSAQNPFGAPANPVSVPSQHLVARWGTRRRRLLLRELLLGLGLLLVAAVHVASLRPTCAICICQSRRESTFLILYERKGREGEGERSRGNRPRCKRQA